ncbi:MAG: hypothetical protein V4621_03115 [Pseudomonadota bacterium]
MNLQHHSLLIPHAVHSVTHPLVADFYIKQEYSREKPYACKDILVIEANFSERVMNHRQYRALMAELFLALPDIKEQVESNLGVIDRVDIKTH